MKSKDGLAERLQYSTESEVTGCHTQIFRSDSHNRLRHPVALFAVP